MVVIPCFKRSFHRPNIHLFITIFTLSNMELLEKILFNNINMTPNLKIGANLDATMQSLKCSRVVQWNMHKGTPNSCK